MKKKILSANFIIYIWLSANFIIYIRIGAVKNVDTHIEMTMQIFRRVVLFQIEFDAHAHMPNVKTYMLSIFVSAKGTTIMSGDIQWAFEFLCISSGNDVGGVYLLVSIVIHVYNLNTFIHSVQKTDAISYKITENVLPLTFEYRKFNIWILMCE